MRYFKCLLLSSLFFLIVCQNGFAQCRNELTPSCSVYNTCFDKFCPCENSPYPYFLRYGRKYCDRFLASDGWSPKGMLWRDKTLLCLQEKIVPKLRLTTPPICDCQSMRDFAFVTHVECYTQTQASVCSLEYRDYYKLYKILDVKDDLFRDPLGRRQMKEVLQICKQQLHALPAGALALIDKLLLLFDIME